MEFYQFKQNFRKNKITYISVGITTVVVAGITSIIMRRFANIGPCDTGTTSFCVTETGDQNVVNVKDSILNNVSIFSSHRQGAPSWIVRCLETGEVFQSQRAAAIDMGISEVNISKHLNGLQETAEGYHFVRLAMAA